MLMVNQCEILYVYIHFLFECQRDHRDLNGLTHSFPTRRSSGLGEAVRAVDVHRARSANALAARAAESERRILIGLDLDQRVEDHRPAIVEINLENVVAGIFARIGIVAVDLETLHARRIAARLVLLALPDDAVLGRSEEHTSELQSLMRIAYAVFCLKKK